MQKMVDAICGEIELRSNTFSKEAVNTIYLGGGTPSLLNHEQLQALLQSVFNHYTIAQLDEVTLECNPENVNVANMDSWRSMGITRLSVGLQSFDDHQLKGLNRNHDAAQAYKVLELLKNGPFPTYTVDLMYGLPNMTNEQWQSHLETVAEFQVPHFSAYALTVEENTQLHYQLEKGQISLPDEEAYAAQFQLLQSFSAKYGYDAYEISNYAKTGHRAVHNAQYWQGVPYLGFGPGAHSFHQNVRSYNIANNHRYMRTLQNGKLALEHESLSSADRYNEYLMVRLRTAEGINLQHLVQEHGEVYHVHLQQMLKQKALATLVETNDQQVTLSADGKFLSDYVIKHLMYV